MIDELIVFSKHTKFKIVFLRVPNAFYNERLAQLKNNGIEIVCRPFMHQFNFRKLLFILPFILSNFSCFFSKYSFVVGVKSIWWFLKIDDGHFKENGSIHAQFATQPALLAMLLCQYHQKRKLKYFFTFHAYDIFFNNKWFVQLVNHSRKCFSISNYNINYVVSKYPNLNKSKIKLSRLGAFPIKTINRSRERKEDFFVGFISWFVEKKGIRYLLEAMNAIAQKNKNIKLVLAGDGPLREEIETFIKENRLEQAVQYIGKLNFDEKSEFFLNLDAVILPAITLEKDKDGIPVVLMEALSYGLPIIATNISGIPEICVDNFNGILIPERNVSSLIHAIETLYGNEVLSKQYSKNALQLFHNYNIESNSFAKLKVLDWI